MVVLVAAIITRSGLPILARQFIPASKSRIESLLSSFPKLIQPSQQHAFVETEDVRFLYQPLDKYFLIIITNKASNILYDIETLRMLGKVVPEYCQSLEEDLVNYACDILLAFDEIISQGYRVGLTMTQLHTILAMESHEELVQDIIAKNKIQEAKEAAKLKIKQIELQKKEAKKANLRLASTVEPVAVKTIETSSAVQAKPAISVRIGKGMKLSKA